MTKINDHFDSINGQRYYHVVAYENRSYSLQSFWTDAKIQKRNIQIIYESDEFFIQNAKLITDIRYHNGEENFSVDGGEDPPFQYEIFAIEIKKFRLLIFGFPFRSLAKSTLDKIADRNAFFKRGNYIKPDLDKLIKLGNNKSAFINGNFSAHFSGIHLTLTDETNISSVNLDGDKPLDTNLYKTVFLKKIEKDECFLEKCTLKCEILKDDISDIPKTKSSIHLDLFGNYKFYVHNSGKNIFTIPLFFNLLSKAKTLKTTSLNPIHRSKDQKNKNE